MFTLAILIGIYSYCIFFLGIAGFLYKEVIISMTILFWGSFLWWKRNIISNLVWNLKKILRLGYRFAQDDNRKRLILLLVSLFTLQALVNLIGASGPELAFDALWYHLTLPKLYLQNHFIEYIPGGLLYYSAMPKLGEMLYTAGLAFGDETIPKIIHFSFGLLTCVALYKLSRNFFSQLFSLLAVIIFYANLVIGWESITAYVDLIRAFFEVMALWAFVHWFQTVRRKWLVFSAVMIGLAVTTKLLAIGSIIIFLILLLYKNLSTMREALLFCLIAFAIPLPWFVFSYVYTGNPVFPFFTDLYAVTPEAVSLFGFMTETWLLFTQSADPISPIYVIFFPLIIVYFYRFRTKSAMTIIGIYSLVSIIIWYFTPRTGGGRFILPYLPAFSLLCAGIVATATKENKSFAKFLVALIVFVSLISIGYRFAANMKYLPVIFGQQSKHEFLTKNLNYSYGDFYDTDDYFQKHIKATDTILLYGFHNIYYVPFSVIDSSWRKGDERFTYVATQNTSLPEEFNEWKLVYENRTTMVKLYRKP